MSYSTGLLMKIQAKESWKVLGINLLRLPTEIHGTYSQVVLCNRGLTRMMSLLPNINTGWSTQQLEHAPLTTKLADRAMSGFEAVGVTVLE
jgi:hypothetical protein